MKRYRDVESMDMVRVLMMLSHGAGGEYERSTSTSTSSPGRVFECKTCNRQFQSFQALGGHRASHKKLRITGESQPLAKQPRVHECGVCGLEFAIGQALGGHMRRHRAAATEGFAHGILEKKSGDHEKALSLDLNLAPPPSGVGTERRIMVFGIDLVENTPMVDCFH